MVKLHLLYGIAATGTAETVARRPDDRTEADDCEGIASMADRYQSLTGTTIGKLLVKNLGLPNPTALARYIEGEPLVAGRILVGGTGRLREPAEQTITAAAARSSRPR